MKVVFENVAVSALGACLPSEEITSRALEERLAPCYERLALVPGRLELMTGIQARRHFAVGRLPSDIATAAAEDLFLHAPERRGEVEVLIHASVCRNFLEPATAAVVHKNLGLNPSCLIFDLSNACLSAVNALVVGGALVESGQARYVLIVSGEDARSVVDNTIQVLNEDKSATRGTVKKHLASLTLGSGGSAFLLTASPQNSGESVARLMGGAFRSATNFSSLCQSTGDHNNTTLMETDSEAMLHAGVALAVETWSETRTVLGWAPHQVSGFVPHQVGKAHSDLMKQRLELAEAREHSTFAELGNMGAASIGVTLVKAAREKKIEAGSRLALLGIGSGLVCGMLGLEWKQGPLV